MEFRYSPWTVTEVVCPDGIATSRCRKAVANGLQDDIGQEFFARLRAAKQPIECPANTIIMKKPNLGGGDESNSPGTNPCNHWGMAYMGCRDKRIFRSRTSTIVAGDRAGALPGRSGGGGKMAVNMIFPQAADAARNELMMGTAPTSKLTPSEFGLKSSTASLREKQGGDGNRAICSSCMTTKEQVAEFADEDLRQFPI